MQDKTPWMNARDEAVDALGEMWEIVQVDLLFPAMEKMEGVLVWLAWKLHRKDVLAEATLATIEAVLDDDDDWGYDEEEYDFRPWGSEDPPFDDYGHEG